MDRLRKLLKYIKRLFWTEPVTRPLEPKATDVVSHHIVIDYKGQNINLHKRELTQFQMLSRKDKRAMAARFAKLERQGKIKFVEINGTLTCVKNKDYGKKAEAVRRD